MNEEFNRLNNHFLDHSYDLDCLDCQKSLILHGLLTDKFIIKSLVYRRGSKITSYWKLIKKS